MKQQFAKLLATVATVPAVFLTSAVTALATSANPATGDNFNMALGLGLGGGALVLIIVVLVLTKKKKK